MSEGAEECSAVWAECKEKIQRSADTVTLHNLEHIGVNINQLAFPTFLYLGTENGVLRGKSVKLVNLSIYKKSSNV